jgi:hypothetical protein
MITSSSKGASVGNSCCKSRQFEAKAEDCASARASGHELGRCRQFG